MVLKAYAAWPTRRRNVYRNVKYTIKIYYNTFVSYAVWRKYKRQRIESNCGGRRGVHLSHWINLWVKQKHFVSYSVLRCTYKKLKTVLYCTVQPLFLTYDTCFFSTLRWDDQVYAYTCTTLYNDCSNKKVVSRFLTILSFYN